MNVAKALQVTIKYSPYFTIQTWVADCKRGWKSMEDAQRSGRTKTVTTT